MTQFENQLKDGRKTRNDSLFDPLIPLQGRSAGEIGVGNSETVGDIQNWGMDRVQSGVLASNSQVYYWKIYAFFCEKINIDFILNFPSRTKINIYEKSHFSTVFRFIDERTKRIICKKKKMLIHTNIDHVWRNSGTVIEQRFVRATRTQVALLRWTAETKRLK